MYVYPKHHTERDICSLVMFVLFINQFLSLLLAQKRNQDNLNYKSRTLF